MANVKISELTEADLPLDGTEDIVLNQDGVTKRCSTQDVADLATSTLPYTVYTALVSQSGGTVTAIQLQNTIGDGGGSGTTDIAWTNPSNGKLRATMSTGSPFTSNKTFFSVTSYNGGGNGYFVCPSRQTGAILDFDMVLYDNTQSATPNVTNLCIEIRVYP